ncbi:DNA-directed RNA polymerase [Operophtera brumata]|uniref:DNA-directed RNA polymerase n=1 Tax=Operophtera brumata TaxID=104452 RepID=A0A0L7L641_OPEBR|nr:DNA-directed RNA polymerase [Operophtera brumata]
MDVKKITNKTPSLAYTSHPDYRKPPKIANPYLQSLGAPHIDSFNYMIKDGLKAAVEDLVPVEFQLTTGDRIKISIDDALFTKPSVPLESVGVRSLKVLPTECRQRAATYKADFKVRLTLTMNDKVVTVDRSVGCIPIMVRSKMCHLADLSPEELVEHNEHADEWGGYFIVKGHERLARMLLVTRRNFPVAIKRPNWRMRGNLFSDYGVMIRLHFLTNGTAKLMFSYRKTMYYAPLLLILKCLVDWPDHYIYRLLLHGKKNDLYYYLGRMFRPKLELPPWKTDLEAARFLLDRCVMIHLKEHRDKFHGLEVLTGGHLYLQVLKERLQTIIKYDWRFRVQDGDVPRDWQRTLSVCEPASVQGAHYRRREHQSDEIHVSLQLLPDAWGFVCPVHTPDGAPCGLLNHLTTQAQVNIFFFVFFMEMRTTEARQLLPDAWGFDIVANMPLVLEKWGMEPVSCIGTTPLARDVYKYPVFIDGRLVGYFAEDIVHKAATHLRTLKVRGEEIPISTEIVVVPRKQVSITTSLERDVYKYPVFGRLVGYFAEDIVHKAATHLRTLKVRGEEIPISTEIVVVPRKQVSITTSLERDVYKYPVFGRLVGYFAEDIVHKAATHLRTLKVRGEEIPISTEIVVVPRKQVSITTSLERDVYKYPVFGRLVGYFAEDIVHKAATHLRTLKVRGEEIPISTEIVVVPRKQVSITTSLERDVYKYPVFGRLVGYFAEDIVHKAATHLWTLKARMMRPVINLATGQLELIGTLEQLYLDVAVAQNEIIKGTTITRSTRSVPDDARGAHDAARHHTRHGTAGAHRHLGAALSRRRGRAERDHQRYNYHAQHAECS